MTDDDPKRVYEPEVLPPDQQEKARAKAGHPVGPILGGILIDLIDFGTHLPLIGLVLGGVAGYWASRLYPTTPTQRVILTVAAAVYCAIPRTHFMPVATIAGVITYFGARMTRTR